MAEEEFSRKKCRSCGEEKPFDEYRKRASAPDGFSYQCKACLNERGEKYREENREKLRESYRKNYWKYPEQKRQNSLAYYQKNREEIRFKQNVYQKKYYRENRDALIEKGRRIKAANREKLKEHSREYYLKNKEVHRERVLRWQRNNPEALRLSRLFACNARRAQKISATPKWADESAMRTLYAKAREWSERLGVQMNVDHVVPLRSELVCGLHCEQNLQLLEFGVNVAKSNKLWPDMP